MRAIYKLHTSIRYKGACLWNSLNTNILQNTSLTNLNNYIMHIKNILLNNYI